MHGIELSPASAIVRPYREAMFAAHCHGQLAALLVGMRRSSLDAWVPAIDDITVTSVVSRGISLAIGPWQDLGAVGEIGWPLFGYARAPLVVYVRNDRPELVELRAVLVLHDHGDGRNRERPKASERLLLRSFNGADRRR